MGDSVKHPEHYTSHPSGIEAIEVTRHHNFDIGNAIKYLWRQGLKKDPDRSALDKQIEDLKKAPGHIPGTALPGQVGVAQATAGPGVTNCVTAITIAHIERVPLLRTGSCPPSPQDYLARCKASTSRRSSRQMLRNAPAIKPEEKPVDLARTALYPLGDLSAFVCGQTIVVDAQGLGVWAAEIRARAKASRGGWQGACEAHGWPPATSMQRRQTPRLALALRVGPGLRPMRRCNAGPGVKPGLHAAPSLGLKPDPTRVRISAAHAPRSQRPALAHPSSPTPHRPPFIVHPGEVS